MNYDITTLTQEAVSLLQALITIPSLSREEEKAADYLQHCRKGADGPGCQCHSLL